MRNERGQFMKGNVISKERIAKMTGMKLPPRTKKWCGNLSKSLTGKKRTEKSKTKQSETRKSRVYISSEKQKQAVRKANLGCNNKNWKGGITPLIRMIRNSYRYQQWRSSVFERDGYICQDCGIKSGNGKAVYIEAHHIKRFSHIMEEYDIKTLEDAYACEELWNINNGITFCSGCHSKTKGRNKK